MHFQNAITASSLALATLVLPFALASPIEDVALVERGLIYVGTINYTPTFHSLT